MINNKAKKGMSLLNKIKTKAARMKRDYRIISKLTRKVKNGKR